MEQTSLLNMTEQKLHVVRFLYSKKLGRMLSMGILTLLWYTRVIWISALNIRPVNMLNVSLKY